MVCVRACNFFFFLKSKSTSINNKCIPTANIFIFYPSTVYSAFQCSFLDIQLQSFRDKKKKEVVQKTRKKNYLAIYIVYIYISDGENSPKTHTTVDKRRNKSKINIKKCAANVCVCVLRQTKAIM